jgi:hypothetical protein
VKLHLPEADLGVLLEVFFCCFLLKPRLRPGLVCREGRGSLAGAQAWQTCKVPPPRRVQCKYHVSNDAMVAAQLRV